MEPSFRDKVEEELGNVRHVRPLKEGDARFIEDLKDGTFGLSYLGFLLYCNGRNARGFSTKHPKGLIYFDGQNLFGVGVFRREAEKEKGHLVLHAPRGVNVISTVSRFSEEVARSSPSLAGQLLYVRSLTLEQYREFLQRGFAPVQEEPWHTEAFAEDETYNYSTIDLEEMLQHEPAKATTVSGIRSFRRRRNAINRFEKFLQRYGLEWKAREPTIEESKSIVKNHFQLLEKNGKRVGSTPEDYWNVLEATKESHFAVMMSACKGDVEVPTSIFVGEKVSDKRLAMYCCISRRDSEAYAEKLGLPSGMVGFSALSTYALLKAFLEVKKRFPEVEEVALGGSETPDLNAFKRRLGARNEPTYWVVKKIGGN